jgi:2-polyprenyl-3-methyl-5-hydroxy-6-metoxy-1,4-benzoquinol methylase
MKASFSDPRKAAEVRHGRAIAARAESVWGWHSPAGRLRAARRGQLLAEAAGFAGGMRVLELGCGTGIFTRQFAGSGAAVLAVDISLDLLRAGISEDGDGIPAQRAAMDVEDLGLRPESFDAVVGVSVLHHVDLPRTLAEIRRVLRPGGRVCFSEPNMLNPQVAAMKKIPLVRRLLGETPHETAFIRWRLAAALRRHGFTDVRVVPFDFLHALTPRRAIPAVASLGRAAERTPLLREIAGSLLLTATRP